MKKLLNVVIVVACFFTSHSYAADKTSCSSSFRNADDKAFCVAISQKNISSCDAIGNGDKKNFCLAQITSKASYCDSIGSPQYKKQCISMTSGKDTVASHGK